MRHFIADLKIKEDVLLNDVQVYDAFVRMCWELPISVITIEKHFFQPFGLTAFAILAESHISIHTWPEKELLCFDLFTCSKDDFSIQEVLACFDIPFDILSTIVVGRGVHPDGIE
jgi:S-adenosylmethionine decarboxylase